jgi:hypothetical protein
MREQEVVLRNGDVDHRIAGEHGRNVVTERSVDVVLAEQGGRGLGELAEIFLGEDVFRKCSSLFREE